MGKSPLFDLVFYFQLFGTILYLMFGVWIIIGLRRLRTKAKNSHQPSVSVIIAARNEEKNIGACLNALLQQNYPQNNIEIIVVDDHSEDQTAAICRAFDPSRVKLYALGDVSGVSPKKAALHYGIQRSHGEIILVSDADCRASLTWVSTVVNYFDKNTAAVASWLYVEENRTLLSKLESLDSLSLSFVGAAGFGWGRPILANGANFAYRREVYDELNGFDGLAHFVSGDDDLLLQKIHAAQKWTCAFAPDWGGAVVTDANPSLRRFFEQRFRWASKSSIYPAWVVGFEVFVYFYLLSFLVTVPLFLFNGLSITYLVPFLLKFGFDFVLMRCASPHVHKNVHPLHLFLTEWLQIFYVMIVGIGGLRGNYTWKGRHYTRGRVS